VQQQHLEVQQQHLEVQQQHLEVQQQHLLSPLHPYPHLRGAEYDIKYVVR
jgi:hypothetical protein